VNTASGGGGGGLRVRRASLFFAAAGREVASLRVDYESLDPWPLESVENKDVPYSERITKMKLAPTANRSR
jgi:hypothetical protein